MTSKLSRDYHAHRGNYSDHHGRKTHIVIHNTGNTASAKSEARYAHNDQHASSFHYVLDGTWPIYQTLESYKQAWAVGAWAGARQLLNNDQTISIEVVSKGKDFSEAEIRQLEWLVPRLMKIYGIPAKNVVRHYDCHTGRKKCPAAYVDAAKWAALNARITGVKKAPAFKAGTYVVTAKTLNVRKAADSTKDNVVGWFKKGAKVEVSTTTINKHGNTWGKVKSGTHKGRWIAMRFSGTDYVKKA